MKHHFYIVLAHLRNENLLAFTKYVLGKINNGTPAGMSENVVIFHYCNNVSVVAYGLSVACVTTKWGAKFEFGRKQTYLIAPP